MAAVAARLGKRAPVAFRVNPDVDAKTHPYISTGLQAEQVRRRLRGRRAPVPRGGAHAAGRGGRHRLPHRLADDRAPGPSSMPPRASSRSPSGSQRAGIASRTSTSAAAFGIRYRDEAPAPIERVPRRRARRARRAQGDADRRSGPRDRRQRGRAAHARGVREAGRREEFPRGRRRDERPDPPCAVRRLARGAARAQQAEIGGDRSFTTSSARCARARISSPGTAPSRRGRATCSRSCRPAPTRMAMSSNYNTRPRAAEVMVRRRRRAPGAAARARRGTVRWRVGLPHGERHRGRRVVAASVAVLVAVAVGAWRCTSRNDSRRQGEARRHAGRPRCPWRWQPRCSRACRCGCRRSATWSHLPPWRVKARVDGQIVAVNFREGQEVRRGEVLFRIDARPFEAALQAGRGERAARRRGARPGALAGAALPGAARQEFHLQGGLRADPHQRADRRGERQGEPGGARERAAEPRLLHHRSPIDGYAGKILLQAGNLVKANDISPLVVINQVKPIYVSFAVPEQQLPTSASYMAQGPLAVEVAAPGRRQAAGRRAR